MSFKCKYCKREMNVSILEYKSNSYCNLCFEERVEDFEIKQIMLALDKHKRKQS